MTAKTETTQHTIYGIYLHDGMPIYECIDMTDIAAEADMDDIMAEAKRWIIDIIERRYLIEIDPEQLVLTVKPHTSEDD